MLNAKEKIDHTSGQGGEKMRSKIDQMCKEDQGGVMNGLMLKLRGKGSESVQKERKKEEATQDESIKELMLKIRGKAK